MPNETDGSGPARLLLLTGTPGSGKRTIGAFLATQNGFRHLDLSAEWMSRVADLKPLLVEGDTVLTCSDPCPTRCLELLSSLGADWVWLDCDRGAALPRPIELIGRGGTWTSVGAPRFVDPFEADGSFRPVAAVAAEVLATSGHHALAVAAPCPAV